MGCVSWVLTGMKARTLAAISAHISRRNGWICTTGMPGSSWLQVGPKGVLLHARRALQSSAKPSASRSSTFTMTGAAVILRKNRRKRFGPRAGLLWCGSCLKKKALP